MRYGAAFNAVMFRRTLTSADDAIARSKEIYKPLGGRFNQTFKNWGFPNGARIRFRYLDTAQDAEHYQGQNISHAWVEEAGQYPSPAPIDRLYGVLRSPVGLSVQLTLTANPGGAGQHWLRQRYRLHPLPKAPKIHTRVTDAGREIRVAVIPARLQDNKILMRRDPHYQERLELVGSAALVRAWLDGDWSAVEGAFFDDWKESDHVLDPFSIPEDWTRIISFDWGSAKPFSVGFWAEARDDMGDIERGTLIRYKEWYGASGPDKGLKLTAEAVGSGIRERSANERIDYHVADPAIFAQDGGPSIAERMGIPWIPGNNRRIARKDMPGGWDLVRERIRKKKLRVFETCTDFIRTVPLLQHDPIRPEDLDTKAEDHIADETRYCCALRLDSGTIDNDYRKGTGDIPVSTCLPPRVRSEPENWNRARR